MLALGTASSADNVNYGRPGGAGACISRPPRLLILPSKVPVQRPQMYLTVAGTHTSSTGFDMTEVMDRSARLTVALVSFSISYSKMEGVVVIMPQLIEKLSRGLITSSISSCSEDQ